jgi:hypothetical protein
VQPVRSICSTVSLSSGGRCDFIKKYNLKEKGCKT